jgi:hypothetical protein
MRIRGGGVVVLAGALAAAVSAPAADDAPAPLLKRVNPGPNALRVRFPISYAATKPMNFTAVVPNEKRTAVFAVTVALSTLPGAPLQVSAKKLEKWGYAPGPAREFVFPEFLIPTAQIAPKVRESDAVIRLKNVPFAVVETPNSADGSIHSADLTVPLSALYADEDRADPRLSYTDRFVELTVPAADVYRTETSAIKPSEPTATRDPALVPAACPFAYTAVNGRRWYPSAEGTIVRVRTILSAGLTWSTGIIMSGDMARGCGVELDADAKPTIGVGLANKSEYLPGKIKELRLGLLTGPDLTTEKDLVLRDVPVMINKESTFGKIYIGPKFVETYFKDGISSRTGGEWRLHTRVDPDRLFDIATRTEP